MAKRQVFFSFRFLYDAWRVSQIRNMGKISDDSTFSDNDWETVRSNSPDVIKKWIENQMKMRSCVVVLIGEYTQGRKWINYEIEQAWKAGKGIVGIYIHGLKDEAGGRGWKNGIAAFLFLLVKDYRYLCNLSEMYSGLFG